MRARLAGVEVGVRQIEAAPSERVERAMKAFARALEALEKQRLGLLGRRLELQRPQRANLRQQLVEKRQEPRHQAGLLVVGAIGLVVFLRREVEDELLLGGARDQFLDLLPLVTPCDTRDLRNRLADRVAVRADREILGHEHLVHLQAVDVEEGALEHRLRDLKADEALIHVRDIGAARRLDDVERELDHHVIGRRVRIGDDVAELGAKFWKHQRDRAVHRLGMADVVGGVVRERAEREGVLVDVVRLAQHRLDEIAGAHVVQQVAEEVAAERVVAEVLNHRAAVGVAARHRQFLAGGAWKAARQQRPQAGLPERVDVGFVRQHRVGTRVASGREQQRRDRDGDQRRISQL